MNCIVRFVECSRKLKIENKADRTSRYGKLKPSKVVFTETKNCKIKSKRLQNVVKENGRIEHARGTKKQYPDKKEKIETNMKIS